MAIAGGIGFEYDGEVEIEDLRHGRRADVALFGETSRGFPRRGPGGRWDELQESLQGFAYDLVGTTGGDRFKVGDLDRREAWRPRGRPTSGTSSSNTLRKADTLGSVEKVDPEGGCVLTWITGIRKASRRRRAASSGSTPASSRESSPSARTSGSTRCSTGGRSPPASPISDGERTTAMRDMGLVSQVFDGPRLAALEGGTSGARPRPLLDDGLRLLGERPARVRRPRRRERRRRPQRQPGQRGAAAGRVWPRTASSSTRPRTRPTSRPRP